jgi:hypothetical protein
MLTAITLVQTHETTWQVVREWMIAFGTVLAVAVAVLTALISGLWRKPRLSLHHERDHVGDEVVLLDATSLGSGGIASVRLRVRNKRGKRAAEDVEVLIGHVESERMFEGTLLANRALRVSNSDPPTNRVTVPPGVERHFDLFHTYSGESGIREVQGDFNFDVHPAPTDDTNIIRPHTDPVVITIVVTARNADACWFTINVRRVGSWDIPSWGGQPGMSPPFPEDHVVVSSPRRLPRRS